MPVLYVFGHEPVDTDDLQRNLEATFPEKDVYLLMFYELSFHHTLNLIREQICKILPNLVIAEVDENNLMNSYSSNGSRKLQTSCCKTFLESDSRSKISLEEDLCCVNGMDSSEGNVKDTQSNFHDILSDNDSVTELSINEAITQFGYKFKLKCELVNYKIVFIGKDGAKLRNLMMSYNRNKFYSYNPPTKLFRPENLNVSRSLMKRYYLIQLAKEANIVGIVVGTLGVARYNDIILRLKEMLKKSDKKFYTIVVGKLNVAKLANFMEVDIFVLVACPENSLIDSRDFYKPIVTPYEMEIACLTSREWTGDYITDFSQLLPGSASHVEIETKDEEDEPEFSLISGGMRSNTKQTGRSHGHLLVGKLVITISNIVSFCAVQHK